MRLRTVRPWLRLIAKRTKTVGRRPKRPSERGCRFFCSHLKRATPAPTAARSAIFNSRSLFLVSRTLRDTTTTTTTTVQKEIFSSEHFLLLQSWMKPVPFCKILPLYASSFILARGRRRWVEGSLQPSDHLDPAIGQSNFDKAESMRSDKMGAERKSENRMVRPGQGPGHTLL